MTIKADGGAARKDAGKLRVDLLPPSWWFALAGPMTYGVIKYEARNWERGMPWTKVLGPALRHLLAWLSGQRCDPETGCHHLAHVAWNVLVLMTYDLRGIGENDLTMSESATEWTLLQTMYREPPKAAD